MRTVDSLSKNKADELSIATHEKIKLDSFSVMCFEKNQAKGIFEYVNGSFHKHSVFVKIVPMLSNSRITQIQSEILFRIGVNTSTVGLIITRSFVGANTGGSFLGELTTKTEKITVVISFLLPCIIPF